jgi:hypothetical protein
MKLIAALAASLSLAACASTKVAAPYHNGRLMSDTRYYYDKSDKASMLAQQKAETPAVAGHDAPSKSVAASK